MNADGEVGAWDLLILAGNMGQRWNSVRVRAARSTELDSCRTVAGWGEGGKREPVICVIGSYRADCLGAMWSRKPGISPIHLRRQARPSTFSG